MQPILLLDLPTYEGLLAQLAHPDRQYTSGEVEISTAVDGCTVLRSRSTGVELRFDQDEIDAFVAGIEAGEFNPELQPTS